MTTLEENVLVIRGRSSLYRMGFPFDEQVTFSKKHSGNSIVIVFMRKLRVLKENASYYVTARANRDEMIMKSVKIKELFLTVMISAQKKYRFSFYSFCLLGNCIHFIIRPTASTSLSKIMQWILGVFAMRYNRYHLCHGHVWYDRFKSKIIDDIFNYLDAYIYILKCPVEHSIVRWPSDYPYNDLNIRFSEMLSNFQPP